MKAVFPVSDASGVRVDNFVPNNNSLISPAPVRSIMNMSEGVEFQRLKTFNPAGQC